MNPGAFQVSTKTASLGVVALGRDPFKDGYVPVIEAAWKALPSRQRNYDLRMYDRPSERRKIWTNAVSVRPH